MVDDSLGDRMKTYEAATDARLDVHRPICVRIDGRSFSRFTRGMRRPFDERMSSLMVETAAYLVEQTHARVAYTQSDEISLVYLASNPESDVMFGGRVLKLASVLASMAATAFTTRLLRTGDLAEFHDRLPHFDARVWQVPDMTEATNMLLWRWKDARKNAISMAGQAVFSPKQLHRKTGADIVPMLTERGIDFHAYPSFFKSGTFLRRVAVERCLSDAELSKIPERHRPVGPVMRSEISRFHDDDFIGRADREVFAFPVSI